MYCLHCFTSNGFSDILLQSDGEVLTGLSFLKSEKGIKTSHRGTEAKDLPIFRETTRYLDLYFQGEVPDFLPRYRLDGATPFRLAIADLLSRIPYGETVTYGDLAKEVARLRGKEKMSAQAVGGAVGWNPVSILIPCHRVIGADGSLVGYGGGIENKRLLLALERRR